ncbi:HNH endonuclease [Wenyingzhuangia sp. 2_MG-2023]|uniref:HNH endonuclease n=1 Tax=Wenyingzhuangia sp. 2_MG-2023 TaxID=3062639 RepID=UPI0026E314DC|nr:hypothetical protein [Wenyingzhuangia sp. 2_MG-2023]MDO6737376.1 hypothetical protein [Wenyingzhuangia sp. 2_MG-2023]
MKNIKSYTGSDIGFHNDIVNNSLKKGDVKDNLISNKHIIEASFADYKIRFENKNLFDVSAHGFIGENKSNLLKLYSSQRKAIVELKTELTTDDNNRRNNICPNCTIETVSSLDHFIPKEEFPEFSVNPINLIPCCTTCNSKKKEFWKNDEQMFFLNLYSDIIPNEQFLFVTIYSNIDFSFEIKNVHNIDDDLFNVIESHYDKLELLQRFKENADNEISELEYLIDSCDDKTQDELARFLLAHYKNKEAKFGMNNWKIVLVKAMIESGLYFRDEMINN